MSKALLYNLSAYLCANATAMCEDIHNDVSFASVLAEKYPSNVYLLRYEDFILNPEGRLKILLKFLELPLESSIARYLKNQVKSNQGLNIATAWMKELSSENISLIQKSCLKSMSQMGYANFSNQESLIDVLTKTRVEVWPYITFLSRNDEVT